MWARQLSALTERKRMVGHAVAFYVYTHRHPVGQFNYGNSITPIQVRAWPLKGPASTPPGRMFLGCTHSASLEHYLRHLGQR